MTPVILLSDGYIASGSAPWKIKSVSDMPEIKNNIIKEDNETGILMTGMKTHLLVNGQFRELKV